jgi:hypothetical protein
MPTAAERDTFVGWAAAGPASSRVLTARRSESSHRQEEATRAAAKAAQYQEVSPPGALTDPLQQMPPGSYVPAARLLARTSMDVPIRLKAGHRTGIDFVAVECKVSNSSLNSRKRLIEVGNKRETWDSSARARYSFRTGAILAGVYDITRLLDAQRSGIYLFWEHRLSDLTAFLQ